MGINNLIKDYKCLFGPWNKSNAHPSYIYIDILAVIYKLACTISMKEGETYTTYVSRCDNIVKLRLRSVIFNLWFMDSKHLKGIFILKDDETRERYIRKWCRRRKGRIRNNNNYVIPKAERVGQLITEYYRERGVSIYSNMSFDALRVAPTTTSNEHAYVDTTECIGWRETDQNIYSCIINVIGKGSQGRSVSVMCIINDSDYIMMDTVIRYTYMNHCLPTINYYMINYKKPVNERYILCDVIERLLPATAITIMYMLLYSTRHGNDYIHTASMCKCKDRSAHTGMTYHTAVIKSFSNNYFIKRIKSQTGFEQLHFLYEHVIARCRCNDRVENQRDYIAIVQYIKLCMLNEDYVWYAYKCKPPNNICTVNRLRNALRAFKTVILLGL